MTATATPIRPPAAVPVAQYARDVFTRATGPRFSRAAGAAAREHLLPAVRELGEALEFYELILAGEHHPTSAYGELLHYQPEELRFAEALRLAAEEARDAAREVVRVTGEHVGADAAEYVRHGVLAVAA